MLDGLLERLFGPALEALARRVGASPVLPAVAGFLIGIAALPLIALKLAPAGLAVLIASRIAAAAASAAARVGGTFQAPLPVLDAVVLAGVPFAFALADPSRALAAAFLIFGLVAQSASRVALGRGLVGQGEILIGFAVACVFPDRFGIVAYIIGVLCFVAAGARIAAAGRAS